MKDEGPGDFFIAGGIRLRGALRFPVSRESIAASGGITWAADILCASAILRMVQIVSGRQMGRELFNEARTRVAPLVNQIVERGIEAGVLRTDVTGTDLIFLQIGLLEIVNLQHLEQAAQLDADLSEFYRRFLWIQLDGLRAKGGLSALPVAPLTTEQTHELLS